MQRQYLLKQRYSAASSISSQAKKDLALSEERIKSLEEDHRRALAEKDALILSLKNNVTELDRQKSSVEALCSELRAKVTDLEGQLKTVELLKSEAESATSEAKAENDSLGTRLAEVVAELEELKKAPVDTQGIINAFKASPEFAEIVESEAGAQLAKGFYCCRHMVAGIHPELEWSGISLEEFDNNQLESQLPPPAIMETMAFYGVTREEAERQASEVTDMVEEMATLDNNPPEDNPPEPAAEVPPGDDEANDAPAPAEENAPVEIVD